MATDPNDSSCPAPIGLGEVRLATMSHAAG